MDKIRKRTVTVTKRTLERLNLIHDCYLINKETFVRMAVHHGILKLVNGYRPLRNKYLSEKGKLDIRLPEETWEVFERCMNQISEEVDDYLESYKKLEKKTAKAKWKRVLCLEEKMTHSEMIETLLRIEIDKYWMLIKDVEDKYDDDYEERLYNMHKDVSVTDDLTYPLYSILCQEKEKTGLKKAQLNKYHFTSALVDEYFYKEFDTIFTDADLIIHIDALGLPREKAMALINNLVASGKMIYRTDIGNGNE